MSATELGLPVGATPYGGGCQLPSRDSALPTRDLAGASSLLIKADQRSAGRGPPGVENADLVKRIGQVVGIDVRDG